MTCDTCNVWGFPDCGILQPCPNLILGLNIKGIITKPKPGLETPDYNIEALFVEKSNHPTSEYFKLAFGLARKKNLGFLTMPEVDLFGKTLVTIDRRRVRFDPFDKESVVFCPLNWVQETKTIKKFCHRLYCQSLELSDEFLNWIAKENGSFSELTFDKGERVFSATVAELKFFILIADWSEF